MAKNKAPDKKENVVSASFAYDIASNFRSEMETYKERFEYWKKRCEAAELFIERHPCDPDITDSQSEAYWAWMNIVNEKQPR